ncbi:MAG: pullulanase [Bacteroidetes bacterium]|nr:MAG: pullulanase [Bacteroidota bacterium]
MNEAIMIPRTQNHNQDSFINIFLFLVLLVVMSVSHKPLSAQPQAQVFLDSLYSSKELGCTITNDSTTFRLFAPRATNVVLVLFQRHTDESGIETSMKRDANGVWEYSSSENLLGKYYGYRVFGPGGRGEVFNPNIIIADPYSKAVATKVNWHQPAKTLIIKSDYDWEGDTFIASNEHSQLIIYEAHVRDLTAHSSSGIEAKGTYKGLTEEGKQGGLSYLKNLGVNTIELLPTQKFGNIELPFRDSSVLQHGYPFNTWNPYERNHWGYMTSYFFAPETYYGTDGTMQRDQYNGTDGRAINEFKDMVKTFHKNGIAVIMDVVYNHVSQYDFNPFKYIDKFYYFHCDSNGNYIMTSGCGNDFKTNRPMARRLIVESVLYWMKEYHIDGFRFDLATMIDWETCKLITAEARKINPNVILIAEAWGGGKYDLGGFSDIGWAAWNDLIRNGVKGQNPNDGLGFIFGKFQGGNTTKSFMSYVTGTLREDGGPFVKQEHSINYLESHDDNTMGDFIRLGLHDVKEHTTITDTKNHAKLTAKQLALNKLAAMYLFTAQGPVMIHEGQEFARSKLIAPTNAPDTRVGMIDHNSYDKDNETNYLNYDHAEMNQSLVSYYQGLIALRRSHPILSSAPKEAVTFLKTDDDFHLAFHLDPGKLGEDPAYSELKKDNQFIVLLNGNPKKNLTLQLPSSGWKVVGNPDKVTQDKPFGKVPKKVTVPPTSGMILMKGK